MFRDALRTNALLQKSPKRKTKMSLYLYINLFTIGPLFFSFDKKVAFYKYFKSLFFAIIITACLFIPWDVFFTQNGIWGFNKQYIVGWYLFDLPLEEWLFFVTVPFSCTFIHYVVKNKIKNKIPLKIARIGWNILAVLLLVIGLSVLKQHYTSVTFILCSLAIFSINYLNAEFMKDYILTYLFCCIPFLIVNSILTGSFTENPVVWYNNDHIFEPRIGTIPMEDTIYNLLLLLLICFFTNHFHTLKKARK